MRSRALSFKGHYQSARYKELATKRIMIVSCVAVHSNLRSGRIRVLSLLPRATESERPSRASCFPFLCASHLWCRQTLRHFSQLYERNTFRVSTMPQIAREETEHETHRENLEPSLDHFRYFDEYVQREYRKKAVGSHTSSNSIRSRNSLPTNGIIVGSAFLGLGIWLTLEMLIEIFPKTCEIILTMINPVRLSRRSDSEEFSHLPKRLREIENYMDSIARAEKLAQIQEQEKND
jgi:hypothetical protein